MSNSVVINNQEVSFEVVGEQTFTTSFDVANVFGKRHDNIIAQIKALPKDNFNALNFKAVEYLDKKGELRPCYNLTRDGFSLLVMGFTGERAYKWKVEFLKAFNKMQNLIKTGRINRAHPDSLFGISELSDELSKQKNANANMTSRFLELQSKYISAIERENENLRKAPVTMPLYHKKGTHLSPDEKNEIISLYKKGISKAEISRIVKRSDTAIDNALKNEFLF